MDENNTISAGACRHKFGANLEAMLSSVNENAEDSQSESNQKELKYVMAHQKS